MRWEKGDKRGDRRDVEDRRNRKGRKRRRHLREGGEEQGGRWGGGKREGWENWNRDRYRETLRDIVMGDREEMV